MWRAKAIATQKAAEVLKEKASLLRDRAQQAIEQNRELSTKLTQLQNRDTKEEQRNQELTRRIVELENALQIAGTQRITFKKASETQHTFDEQLEHRSTLEDAGLQHHIQSHGADQNPHFQVERLRHDISYLERELEARESLLRTRELEAVAHYGELDLSKRLIQEMSRTVEDQDRRLTALRAELERTRRELIEKDLALTEKQNELDTLETDSQALVEAFHEEAESLRAEIEFLAGEKLELEQRLSPSAPYSYKDAEIERLQRTISLLEEQRNELEITNTHLQKQLRDQP